ncbi:hypothetical protein CP02DC22_0004B, partial [Chlamydia psittaci 02DC22]
SMNL